MTTVTINLPDRQAAALKAKATPHGLTLEDWISKKLGDEQIDRPARSRQEAPAHIRELQKQVKPDPEGWTVRDYINFGRASLDRKLMTGAEESGVHLLHV